MAHPARDSAKHLDEQQAELVARSRHPGLRDIETDDLATLHGELREHREQARSVKGEVGGGEPRSARRRAEILTQAVKRVSRERARRDRHLARADLREFAADVVGHSMDERAPERGGAKGFAEAAAEREPGEEHPPVGRLHAGRTTSGKARR